MNCRARARSAPDDPHLHRLGDDLAKLKKLEKYAKIAAKVADTLAKAAERLAQAAAKALI